MGILKMKVSHGEAHVNWNNLFGVVYGFAG